ncbi:MAG TPA: RNA 2',3'-cyclic phosphodiesterase [Gemmatimonadaceae bacterium]|nr:RNA 2',3'-cyclic phosphodiesterase [Gemmatimonadaceae bacterium]
MRLFVAINLPPEVRDAIYADAAPLRAATNAVKWVAAPLLHVTLKFLGEQPDALVADLTKAVEGVGERHATLEVRTTEMGAFPNFRRPRVVWVGMTGQTELRALADDIDRTFTGFGIAPEVRSFKAHLTLGRVKGEMSSADAGALASAASNVRESRHLSVRTVDLMRSELGPGGPRYTVLAPAPLHVRGT